MEDQDSNNNSFSKNDINKPFPEDNIQNENINNINKDKESEKTIEPKSKNIVIHHGKKVSLMDNPINEKKIINLSKYFEESFKVEIDDLINDNEESKDILLSFEKDKSLLNPENDLISENQKQNENQYLKPKFWKYLDKKYFEDIDKKYILIKNKLNKEEIKTIIDKLKENSVDSLYKIKNEKDSELKINKMKNFENMIENYFNKTSSSQKMINEDEKEELKKYIFKYREIYKDNNNFYRCVIFSFLEYIILTNNIMFLKELLIEIDDKICINNNKIKNNDYLKNEIELYIHINLIKELLYILIKYMSENINNSYEFFIKIYLLYDDFDYGIIFIIRYLLHEYINENKYKIYCDEDNEIEISDLLPSKYKQMYITTEKKFDLFFINELFKMKSYDCKIIFYLIPYFLDINLKILTYYEGTEKPVHCKSYRENNDKYTLELISCKGFFDICYNKKYYEYHSKTFNIFEEKTEKILSNKKDSTNSKNSVEESIIEEDKLKINDINISIKEDLKEKCFICDNCSKGYKGIINKLNFCQECLEEELKIDILKLYGLYLQYVDHNYQKYSIQIEKYFRSIIRTIKIKNYSIYEVMEGTGYSVYEILNIVKRDICLICRNDTIKNYYYELPCKCRLCSKKCFKKYRDIMIYKHFDKINKNNFKRQIFVFDFCICGKKYYYNDLLVLYNYFKTKNKLEDCDKIIKIVKNRWKWRCIKCDKLFDPFCMNYRLSLYDPKINEDFYEKEIKHLICSDCYDVIYVSKTKYVKCAFCKSEHLITNSIRVNYENKSDDLCFLI